MKALLILALLSTGCSIRTAQQVRRWYGNPQIVYRDSVCQFWHYRENDGTQENFLIWNDSSIHGKSVW